MNCNAYREADSMVNESLMSLLAHGARHQARNGNNQQQLRADAPPPVVAPRVVSPEERRSRLRSVLDAAAKVLAEDVMGDDKHLPLPVSRQNRQ
jgi:hypothetical protein